VGTPNATLVQRLIRDCLDSLKQFSASWQLVGGSGKDRLFPENISDSSPAPSVAVKSIGDTEQHPDWKINPCPDWSRNVTDALAHPSEDNTGQDIAVNDTFDIAEIKAYYQEFLLRKARWEEDGEWIKDFQDRLDKTSGGAERFVYDGHEVATYKRNGNLSVKRLEAEQPEVVARYTRLVQELKFDRQAFEAEEPELYQAYRAKVFRVSKRSVLGIF
jgi:hypothetical protein